LARYISYQLKTVVQISSLSLCFPRVAADATYYLLLCGYQDCNNRKLAVTWTQERPRIQWKDIFNRKGVIAHTIKQNRYCCYHLVLNLITTKCGYYAVISMHKGRTGRLIFLCLWLPRLWRLRVHFSCNVWKLGCPNSAKVIILESLDRKRLLKRTFERGELISISIM
jgi:hypothetical protein